MNENLDLTENIEINQALKEFEIKSQAEQIQKPPEVSKDSDVPKMVKLVMKWSGGAIKEPRQAEYVLFGFVVLAVLVSLFLSFRVMGLGKSLDQEPTEEMLRLHPELIK